MSLGVRAGISAVMAFTAVITLSATCFAAPGRKGADVDELKQYVENLKKSPADKALREKIIRMSQGMKRLPLPEEAQRFMARGTAFAQRASDTVGYKRAIVEFEAASNVAPWLGLAYFNLGVMQEKAGLFTDAIQSLRWYLLATPRARNARDVKNKIYALEADAEAVAAGMNSPDASDEPGENGKLGIAGTTDLEIAPEKQFKIIKMPQDKKASMPNFAGNWYFKEKIRGEDVTIHAFEIRKNSNGDLTLVPPKRVADSYARINIFEIKDNNLMLQMKWKMKSVVGYWKTETYVLRISADGSKLTGSHNQKSVGGRNIDMDRVLFRQ
jgi:hypothetical protein